MKIESSHALIDKPHNNKSNAYYLLLVMIMSLLSACGPEGEDMVTLNDKEPFTFTINNCPSGRSTTLFSDVDGIGPGGVFLRGVNGILSEGDEILRGVDCGDGLESYAFGKVIEIDPQNDSVKIELYSDPVKVEVYPTGEEA